MIGVPTLRTEPLSWDWANAFYSLQIPLGASVARKMVSGKIVADARNEIAVAAIEAECDWVLYVGDDNILPANAFELLARHKKKLVTGVYWTKSYPHSPYIWRDVLKGAYVDWKYGEFFKVDWAGCDCLLVHTDVFKALKYPYFSHDWIWEEGSPKMPLATEDLYFYTKTREAGFDLWCDAECQCGHQERETKFIYGLDKLMPQHPEYEKRKLDGKQIADLGAGGSTPYFEGEVTRFDLLGNPDVRCDVRAIPKPAESYDHVRAHHVLEHFFFWEIYELIKEWLRILKVGGTIEIAVPNMRYAAQQILEGIEKEEHDTSYAFGMIWGTRPQPSANGMLPVTVGEETDNQIHKMGWTRPGLERFLNSFECLGNVEVVEDGLDGDASLTATAKKITSSKAYEILTVWNKVAGNNGKDLSTPERPKKKKKTNGKVHV